MYAVLAEQSLGRCRPSLFWRTNVYDGMRIVDSAGQAFMVDGWSIVRPASKLAQAIARVFETTVQVELQVRPIEPPSIQDLKSTAQSALAEDPESFEELSGRSVEWWGTTLSRANTLQELVNAFASPKHDA